MRVRKVSKIEAHVKHVLSQPKLHRIVNPNLPCRLAEKQRMTTVLSRLDGLTRGLDDLKLSWVPLSATEKLDWRELAKEASERIRKFTQRLEMQ